MYVYIVYRDKISTYPVDNSKERERLFVDNSKERDRLCVDNHKIL